MTDYEKEIKEMKQLIVKMNEILKANQTKYDQKFVDIEKILNGTPAKATNTESKDQSKQPTEDPDEVAYQKALVELGFADNE